MNKIEHLFVCLTEEAAEISQAACKIQRFGPGNLESDRAKTNIEQLTTEVNDLVAILELLSEEGVILPNLYCKEQIELKKKKLRDWMIVSERLNLLH